MPVTRWVRLEDAKEGARQLLGQAREEVLANGLAGAVRGVDGMLAALSAGQLPGGVLTGAEGEPTGLASWQVIEGLGRRVQLAYLLPAHRDLEGWTQFLTALMESPDPAGSVVLICSPIQGLSISQTEALLGRWGLRPYHSCQLTLHRDRNQPETSSPSLTSGHIRPVTRADFDPLARLNATSYEHELERYLFATTRDGVAEARGLLAHLLEGAFGKPVDEASVVLEIDGTIRGAALVTQRPEYFLLADIEIHPEFRGQGHSRRLIRAALEGIPSEPEIPVVLSVIRENTVAYRLYRSMGFVPSGSPDTLWAHPERLGIESPARAP